MMSIQTVLSAVNGFGSTVASTFTTFLTINYFIGQNTIDLLCFIFRLAKAATISILTALHIALEDLSIFLAESSESFINIINSMTFSFSSDQ